MISQTSSQKESRAPGSKSRITPAIPRSSFEEYKGKPHVRSISVMDHSLRMVEMGAVFFNDLYLIVFVLEFQEKYFVGVLTMYMRYVP